jgi:hypothetical protein
MSVFTANRLNRLASSVDTASESVTPSRRMFMRHAPIRRHRSLSLLVLPAIAGTLAGLVVVAPSAAAAPPIPHEKSAIEALAPYQAQFFCRSTVEPGVKAFEKLVLKAYPKTGSDGDMRGCDVGDTSEHKDGRAWDWRADYRTKSGRKAGKAMLHWLFATDAYGNKDAMLRRLGIMYVIWDKRIWGTWSQSWQPYACSGVTLCHINHMHFSFDWAGAEKKTSYWTHQVAGDVEPPLPVLKHGHHTLTVKAASGTTNAMWLIKGGARYVVKATGVWHHSHSSKARADAVCERTADGWVLSSGSIGQASISGDQFGSWGAQWVPTHNNGHGCNVVNHTYRLVISPPHTSTVVGQLADGSRGNDSGAVKLTVTRH